MDNFEAIKKVFSNDDLYLKSKRDGTMYVSKVESKYSSRQVKQMIKSGFNTEHPLEMMNQYPAEVEMWFEWLFREEMAGR